MAEKYDPTEDLAKMVEAGISYRTDVITYAGRIAEQLGLGEDDSVETVRAVLRKALGIPCPRAVTYDMAAWDAYSVLTAALDEFAATQRDRTRAVGGNARRHERADKADEMRKQAEAAWEARDDG